MRYSGLQRQVIALYRMCLREIRKKPEVRATYDSKYRSLTVFGGLSSEFPSLCKVRFDVHI